MSTLRSYVTDENGREITDLAERLAAVEAAWAEAVAAIEAAWQITPSLITETKRRTISRGEGDITASYLCAGSVLAKARSAREAIERNRTAQASGKSWALGTDEQAAARGLGNR